MSNQKNTRGKHSPIYEKEEIEDNKKNNKNFKKKKKKKKSLAVRIIKKVLMLLVIIFVIFLGIAAGYGYNLWKQINYDSDFDKSQIAINEGVSTEGYYNILLFGVDARNQDKSYDGSLSDVIMIVSINQDTKKVKIASVYRDTYLQITGKSFDKITHAFGTGGPSLSMSTINTNLDLDIKDYVAINFNVVVDVVDAVGGVTLDITQEEASYINQYIDEVNKTTGHKSKHITKAGTYTLDGVQATAYARIRYTAGGDWKRTERQRKVLGLVFEKVKKMNIGQINNLANTIFKEVSTNVNTAQVLYLASQAGSYEIEETRGWPGEVADYQPNGVWYGVPRNLEKEVKELHAFLFDEEDYEVTSKVKSISDALIKKTGIK